MSKENIKGQLIFVYVLWFIALFDIAHSAMLIDINYVKLLISIDALKQVIFQKISNSFFDSNAAIVQWFGYQFENILFLLFILNLLSKLSI